MHGIGAVFVISLALWAAINAWGDSSLGSWIYIGAVLVLFQIGMLIKMSAVPDDKVASGEAPYHFDPDEAEVVSRYRYHFMYPASAKAFSSTLAAMGLVGLTLTPWLAFREQWVQGIIIALHTLLIGPLTRKLSPLYALRLAAHKGDPDAERLTLALASAWKKILEVKRQQAETRASRA